MSRRVQVLLALVVATLLLAPAATPASAAQDNSQSFADWLQGVRAEALSRGIRPEIVDQAFAGLDQPLALPLARDRAQPEQTQTIETYISRHVNSTAVRRGRVAMREHRTLLDRVSRAYGVPAPVLVAIWGLESNYGRISGTQPTIAVLATLAWDPRRSDFFRKELFSALEILNRGEIDLSQMRGSWAGAMGELQFMPSSYLAYAVDFDKDGHVDIWDSPADIFASIGNYLKQHGWQEGVRWGREVSLPRGNTIASRVPARQGGCDAKRDMTQPLPLQQWRSLGVKLPGGHALPKADFPASLTSGSRRHFLVYSNYDALLSYNCAHSYALSVALLSDRLW